MRILPNMLSGIALQFGPWNQNARSSCFNYTIPYPTIMYHTRIIPHYNIPNYSIPHHTMIYHTILHHSMCSVGSLCRLESGARCRPSRHSEGQEDPEATVAPEVQPQSAGSNKGPIVRYSIVCYSMVWCSKTHSACVHMCVYMPMHLSASS